MSRARWLVNGQVQGVGFRVFVAREARQLGLTGLARNLPDGRVEVVADGSDEALAQLAIRLGTGPRMARVSHVEKAEILVDMREFKSFDIL